MTLSPAFLDELRARTLLSAVIAPSVKLIKAGREWKACCPFHQEKTPSFTINDEKGFYHCFGCGAHGDAIRFLTDARGLPFMDAVKELASKAGMDVPAPDPRAQARAERSAGLYDVMEAAQKWFEEQLDGIEGSEARNYLKERGISDTTKQRFGFGFAPDSRGKLKKALEKFGIEQLVEAGLLISTDEKKEPYDRFRGRLTYPIRDQRGRVIAFSARIIGQGEPKYLNSPDTPLFDKGRTLFNLDLAGPASRKAGRILVVEGQMDVIALDQAGLSEAVAPLGTALTEHQLERLWRLDSAPILCFDGDAAGRKAAIRAAQRALPLIGPERTLRFSLLPDGLDPDDFLRSEGKSKFDTLLSETRNLHEVLWTHEITREPLDTPEARANLGKRLRTLAKEIQDPDVRTQYLGLFNGLLSEMYDNYRRTRRFETSSGALEKRVVPPEMMAIARDGMTQAVEMRAILRGLRRHPALIGELAEPIASLWIKKKGWAQVREAMLDAALQFHPLDSETLETTLRNEGLAQRLKEMIRSPELPYSFLRNGIPPGIAERDLAAAIEKVVVVASFDGAIGDLKRRFAEAQSGEEEAELIAELERVQMARKSSTDRFSEFWAQTRETESWTETA